MTLLNLLKSSGKWSNDMAFVVLSNVFNGLFPLFIYWMQLPEGFPKSSLSC